VRPDLTPAFARDDKISVGREIPCFIRVRYFQIVVFLLKLRVLAAHTAYAAGDKGSIAFTNHRNIHRLFHQYRWCWAPVAYTVGFAKIPLVF